MYTLFNLFTEWGTENGEMLISPWNKIVCSSVRAGGRFIEMSLVLRINYSNEKISAVRTLLFHASFDLLSVR